MNDDDSQGGMQEGDNVDQPRKQSRELEEKSEEEVSAIKEVKTMKKAEKSEEADKKIAAFLHERGLSGTLIRTLINTDLTNEHIRLLKMLDFNDDDIVSLQDLRQAKVQVGESGDSADSTISEESSADDGRRHLSPSSVYLKKVLSKPLIRALREILMKKPADPVEYLGHWLLHFKLCEERSMQQKQRDLELLINEEILERKEVREERDFLEKKEEEVEGEFGEDWNYLHYGF